MTNNDMGDVTTTPSPRPQLIYRDAPMNPDPIIKVGLGSNMQRERHNLDYVRDFLLGDYILQLELEPGDATSYKIVLTPIWGSPTQRGLIVTYMRSGDVQGSCVLWDWDRHCSSFQLDEQTLKLNVFNGWSQKLLRWWLGELVLEVVR